MAITIPLFFAGDQVAATDLNTIDLREPPICIAKASGTPTVTIPTGGGPVALDTDVLDPLNWHNPVTNNSRITPTINGYYQCIGNVQFIGGTGGTNPRRWAAIRQNGSTQNFGVVMAASGGAVNMGAQVVLNLVLNGTTDYVELMAGQDSGASINIGDYGSTRLSVHLIYAL
jgi:hypothetical protein